MLDGADFYIVLDQHGTAGSFAYVFGYRIDDWLAFSVDSLNLIPVIVRCWIEGHRQVYSGVEPLSTEGKATS